MVQRQTKKQICKRKKDIYEAMQSSVEDGLVNPVHPYADVLKEEHCGETWCWWIAIVEADQIPQFAESHPEILTVNSFLGLCGKKQDAGR